MAFTISKKEKKKLLLRREEAKANVEPFPVTASEAISLVFRRKVIAADDKLAQIARKMKLELGDINTKELETYIDKYPQLEALLLQKVDKINKLVFDLRATVNLILKEAIGDQIVRKPDEV